MTSAANPPGAGSTAVRQAPATLTESPGSRPAPSPAAIRSRAPESPRSIDSTVPISLIRPVNISPLPQPDAREHVLADRLPADRQRSLRTVDPLRAGCRRSVASHRRRRARAERRRAASRRARRRHGRRPRGSRRPRAARSSARGRRAGRAPLRPARGLRPGRRWTSTPASASAATRSRGASGPAITMTGASATVRTSCEPSGSRAVESKTTRRGWRASVDAARGQQRVVGERGLDADGDGVGFGAPAVDALAGLPRRRSTSSRRSPSRCGRRGVSADLRTTSGRPVRACLRKGWLRSRAAAASAPSAQATSTPPSRRIPGPRPLAFSLGSSEPIDDPGDAGGEDRVGARRLAALMCARLERHVHRRAGRIGAALARVGERRRLGVAAAELGVKALADDARRRARRSRRRPAGSG